jgi:hypothetical protein
MTRRSWTLSFALAAVCLAAVGGQDPKPRPRRPDAKALQRARELSATAPQHDVLRRLGGSWKVALRTTGPDGEAREDRGAAVGRAMLGGRYVALDFELDLGGNEVLAHQILGFDTLKGVYTASWRDTMSTWSVDCWGAPGEQPFLLGMRGRIVDAMTPGGRPFRLELDLRDRAAVEVKIYEGAGQEEALVQVQRWTK